MILSFLCRPGETVDEVIAREADRRGLTVAAWLQLTAEEAAERAAYSRALLAALHRSPRRC